MKHILTKFLLLLAFWGISTAMAQEVTGVVKDEKGGLMPGVSVQLVGTTTGAATDINGAFRIKVKDINSSVLRFSFLGMQTQEVATKGKTVLSVTLLPSNMQLEEVVAVGYGYVRKRDLTGAVGSVKSQDIVKTASSNALQSIQGKVAGVDISKSSGESGASINFNMRGNRSITASNAPLILVDGIEYGSTLDINSNDIESIDILKDVSSAAIYGTKGANGVVIITTKRGNAEKDGGRTRVSVNSYVSFNSPTNVPKTMSVEQEYRFLAERQRYSAEKGTAAWGTTNLTSYTPEVVLSNVITSPWDKSLLTLYKEGGVDWFDMIMRNSVSQNYEASVTGGNSKTSFAFSLGFMNEQGLLRNDVLERYNGRLNLDHKILNNLKIGASIQYTTRDWDRRADGVYSQLLKMHSLAEPYLTDGSMLDKPSELAPSHTNPLINERPGYYTNNTKSNRFFGSSYLDWEIIKGLHLKTTFGLDQMASRVGTYTDYMCTGLYQSGKGSYFTVSSDMGTKYTWENTLNYSFNIAETHDFQFLLGNSNIKDVYELHGLSGYGNQDHYTKTAFYNLDNILVSGRDPNDAYTQSTMQSFFGRVNYKLLNRYLLTASLRADGSSAFPENKKWGYFPSVSAAWVLSQEAFLKDASLLNNLKLRLSWGKAGNSSVQPYSTLNSLSVYGVSYSYGSSLVTGNIPVNLGNKDVTWEKTATYDLGVDLGILKNRISASIDIYYSKTTDLLLSKGLPASSVYPQIMANVGSTENKGLEATLNLRVINKRDIQWSSDFTFSTNKDKIVKLANGAAMDVSNPNLALVVGQPVFAFYNYEADGCWKISEAADAAKYGKVPGDIKIVDRNKDGVINDSDKRIYNKSPRFIFGWNNSFTYKGITLSAFAYARVGQWIAYDLNTAYKPTEQDGSPNLDFWTPENQNAKFPRPGIASQNDIPALAFEKASFFKIKEVTLGYTLPANLVAKAGISRLYVYGSMQNYFTFSSIDNYDPERGGAISNPLSKQVVFGVNIDF